MAEGRRGRQTGLGITLKKWETPSRRREMLLMLIKLTPLSGICNSSVLLVMKFNEPQGAVQLATSLLQHTALSRFSQRQIYTVRFRESQCGFRKGRSTINMIFSLRQLQEKCREQQQPLFIAFIDLTKAFDLVSTDGLFKILPRIGCPPKLLSIIKSFHSDMKGTVVFDGSTSSDVVSFSPRSNVKHGCVLAPTLFGIFFAITLKHAFESAAEGIYLRTRSEGKLCNISRSKAKSKVHHRCLRDFLFADDAAVTVHSADNLQRLMDRLSQACKDFGLTISLIKTQIMAQEIDLRPHVTVLYHELDVVHDFLYLGSAISNSFSLNTELQKKDK